MTDNDKKNLRNHFRIVYPAGDRPVFRSTGQVMAIFDISEKGLAVQRPKNFVLARDNALISGRIEFQDGEAVEVSGKVLRTTDDAIILLMLKGVPYATIMNQQRQMIKKYGTLSG